MTTPAVAAIVVAAGRSDRMGTPKALLPLGDTTFFGEIAETVLELGLSPRLCVANIALVGELAARSKGFEFLLNDRPDDGMIRSVQLACRRLKDAQKTVQGALFFLVDNPGNLLRRARILLDAALLNPAGFHIPTYKKKTGHPIYIPARAFSEIAHWSGANGLRGCIAKSGIPVYKVATRSADTLNDIDTPMALEEFRRTHGDA